MTSTALNLPLDLYDPRTENNVVQVTGLAYDLKVRVLSIKWWMPRRNLNIHTVYTLMTEYNFNHCGIRNELWTTFALLIWTNNVTGDEWSFKTDFSLSIKCSCYIVTSRLIANLEIVHGKTISLIASTVVGYG